MKNLFSITGMASLERLCRNPRLLVAFDFDGTLSELVREHQKASLSLHTRALLRELSRRCPVAVVSGRARADLRTRLSTGIGHVIGNHGLEGVGESRKLRQRARVQVATWTKYLNVRLEGIPGAKLENKTYSLSIHYRKSSSKARIRTRLLRIARSLPGSPRLIPGKCVLNLIPQGAPNKGVALLALMKKLSLPRALYVGDDDTDEDVFRLRTPRILGVRVGRHSHSGAAYFLSGRRDVDRLLGRLLKLVRPLQP